ncbi:MAG: hypothetical protein ACOYOK_14015 [Pseudobdellovibrionaceae bacterium]
MKNLAQKIPTLLIAGLVLLSISSCQWSQKKPTSEATTQTTTPGSVSQRMQTMAQTYISLMSHIGTPSRFNADENGPAIKQKIQTLAQASQSLKSDLPQVSLDPSLKILSSQFESEIRESLQSFEAGKKEYARYALQNSLNTCVQCHTRTQAGPAFVGNDFEQQLKQLSPLEKGEVLTATRNFESALAQFQDLLSSDKVENTLIREKAARHALVITVKFLQDPKASLEIAETAAQSKASSAVLKDNARIWKTSIQEWRKEKITPANTAGKIALAKKWIAKAFYLNQRYKDQAGDIYALRASALVHQLLDQSSQPQEKAELLLLAGESYEVLGNLQFTDLNEEFYEACIKQLPHSKIAVQCYNKLEQNIYEGYTGNAGTNIPDEVEDQLEKLNDLASPMKPTAP